MWLKDLKLKQSRRIWVDLGQERREDTPNIKSGKGKKLYKQNELHMLVGKRDNKSNQEGSMCGEVLGSTFGIEWGQ